MLTIEGRLNGMKDEGRLNGMKDEGRVVEGEDEVLAVMAKHWKELGEEMMPYRDRRYGQL